MPLDAADLSVMFGLAPEEAVRFVEAKGYRITWNWWEARDEAHAKALTVAKATRVDILQDIQSALARNLATGEAESDFIKRLTPVLQAKGWWGRQVVVDPEGNAQMVRLGSPSRLATIYRTNAQSAYMAGRYKAMAAATDSHPWWQYVAILDGRTRPRHRALNGKVFHARDAIWRHIWPPNGHNCRCRVRPLSQADLEREGLSPMSSARRIVHIEDATPADPRTGEFEQVRRIGLRVPGADGKDIVFAPDIGFGGNPGRDWARPFAPPPLDTLPRTFLPGQALPGLPAPARVPASRLLPDGLSPEDYARAFLAEFGADVGRPVAFADPAGDTLAISEVLFQDGLGNWKAAKDGRGPYMPLLADALKSPDEIWLRWEVSRDEPGRYLLKRRYLKSWEIDTAAGGDPQYGLSVFEWGKNGWSGSTAMMAKPDRTEAARRRYIEQQRDGFLLWRARK